MNNIKVSVNSIDFLVEVIKQDPRGMGLYRLAEYQDKILKYSEKDKFGTCGIYLWRMGFECYIPFAFNVLIKNQQIKIEFFNCLDGVKDKEYSYLGDIHRPRSLIDYCDTIDHCLRYVLDITFKCNYEFQDSPIQAELYAKENMEELRKYLDNIFAPKVKPVKDKTIEAYGETC